jgi:aspartate 1-decarboxylase
VIVLNSASAHRASRGDRIILCAYGYFTADELDRHDPVVVHVGDVNELARVARPNRDRGPPSRDPLADAG